MSDSSIFETLNDQIRKIDCVSDYQGPVANSSVIEHIATSLVYSTLISWASMICVWASIMIVPAWFFYAPFREFYTDRFKNKGKPKSHVWAQIIERSTGFVVGLPFLVATIILKVWILK